MLRTGDHLYWASDAAWFDVDEDEKVFLTENAPPEAKESFIAYVELQKKHEETGIYY